MYHSLSSRCRARARRCRSAARWASGCYSRGFVWCGVWCSGVGSVVWCDMQQCGAVWWNTHTYCFYEIVKNGNFHLFSHFDHGLFLFAFYCNVSINFAILRFPVPILEDRQPDPPSKSKEPSLFSRLIKLEIWMKATSHGQLDHISMPVRNRLLSVMQRIETIFDGIRKQLGSM